MGSHSTGKGTPKKGRGLSPERVAELTRAVVDALKAQQAHKSGKKPH